MLMAIFFICAMFSTRAKMLLKEKTILLMNYLVLAFQSEK